MKNKRDIQYDLLRIIACIAVIVIHVNSKYLFNGVSSQFYVLNFYTSFVRSAVLLFIMISGMYLLDPERELTLKKLYSKYILRIVLSLIIFNSIYISYYYFFVNNNTDIIQLIKLCFIRTVRGDPSGIQFWYLYLALFLYIITPILRIFTKNANKEDFKYFLIIGFIFTIMQPTITSYSIFKQLNYHNYYAYGMGVIYSFSYVYYYMLGYYIKKYVNISKKNSIALYIGGLMLTYSLALIISVLKGRVDVVKPYYYFSLNVFMMAIGIFMLFKNIKIKEKYNDVISKISKLTFGVYLIHNLLIAIFLKYFEYFNPIIGTPVITILVFLASLLISALLYKIPFLKKYIL